MDMIAISKYVQDAINTYNKMTPEMEEAIKAIIDFQYPDDANVHDSTKVNNDSSDSSDKEKQIISDKSELFNIKVLNDIPDKMIRGSVKKIYMGAKRLNKTSNDVINEIITHLNDNNQMNEEIQELLNYLD